MIDIDTESGHKNLRLVLATRESRLSEDVRSPLL
jgi:hypothetical protein